MELVFEKNFDGNLTLRSDRMLSSSDRSDTFAECTVNTCLKNSDSHPAVDCSRLPEQCLLSCAECPSKAELN